MLSSLGRMQCSFAHSFLFHAICLIMQGMYNETCVVNMIPMGNALGPSYFFLMCITFDRILGSPM